MNKLILLSNVNGRWGIGEYVDEDGGGKVGRVRCCVGVVALSIKILRSIPRFEEVDAADDDLDNTGRA